MNIRTVRAILCGLSLTLLPVLHGQESSSAPVPEEAATGIKRWSFGFRVAGYPFNPLHNVSQTVYSTVDSLLATSTISTSNNYLQVGFGPAVEFAATRHFTLVGELFYHRLTYTQTTQITLGALSEGITENTGVNFWDLPVLVRYRGLREDGFLSHLYFDLGPAMRYGANIKSHYVVNYPNGTSSTSDVPQSANKFIGGAVVGAGMRFVDDFGIKVEPELRYTRWLGRTFDAESTRSSENTIEVDIAFTF